MSFLKLISTFFIFFSISLQARDYIIVQSTTSTANTGLLDMLSEQFFIQTGIEVRAVAVGTGTATNGHGGDISLTVGAGTANSGGAVTITAGQTTHTAGTGFFF